MSKCPMARPDERTTAHRGYLITRMFDGAFRIHRDGHTIQHSTPSVATAKAIIEELTT